MKTFSDKNLPVDFADYLVSESDEETDKKLSTFMEAFGKYESKIREDILKNHTISVPKGKDSSYLNLKEPPANASKEEMVAFYKNQLKNKE